MGCIELGHSVRTTQLVLVHKHPHGTAGTAGDGLLVILQSEGREGGEGQEQAMILKIKI